jgi:membrane protein implicated in regulation of membrane protease activity
MNLRVGPALVAIAIGAIFAFAVTPSAIPGINVNVAGVIVLIVGIIALLLAWRSGRGYGGLSPWLRPSGHDDPRVDEEKRAAAADDAAIRSDDRYFDPAGPGSRDEDDL